MDSIGMGDLVQLGVAAPFCWLFWQYERANREERKAWRQATLRLALAVDRLTKSVTGQSSADAEVDEQGGSNV